MTNPLKSAVIIVLAVAGLQVNAQKKAPAKATKPSTENKAAKPTKQETMDWIGGKMKENLAGTVGDFRHFVSYSNGIFVYKKEVKIDVWYFSTVDLNKITGMSDAYSKDFYVTGKNVLKTVRQGDEYGNMYDFLSISGPNYDDYVAPFNFTPDQALVERLKKAFATLIEYNSTKKGSAEAF